VIEMNQPEPVGNRLMPEESAEPEDIDEIPE